MTIFLKKGLMRLCFSIQIELITFFLIVVSFHLRLIADQIDELMRLPLPYHFLVVID
jgi:hypothetical protein